MRALTADDYLRVRLPSVKPRTKFAYEENVHGWITFTMLEPARGRPSKVRFVKRSGRTVRVTDRPILLQAIKEALADLP